MKQVLQNFKTGELLLAEVPAPALYEKFVLVQNHFSLISSATERNTVSVGSASLLKKAQKRPDLLLQVIENFKREGLVATMKKVQSKLNTLKPLGYSSAGIVKSSLDSYGHFQPDDRVACAGQGYASHAQWVCVPQNLVVKVPENVSLQEASFTTVGAIAMQGVRQACVNVGENVCVIGLGLLGQITCQILKASGCNVLGIDLNDKMVELAKKISADGAINRNSSSLKEEWNHFSKGYHFDKVIITTASNNNDPLILASDMLRKKGVIVLVGVAKIDVPRNPNFYQKELELKLSCSYGPGRYDPQYEEYGNDYPYPYVRWTEQRNMESFLQLLSKGNVQVKPLITHIFDIEKAQKAYDIILGKQKEEFLAVLLKYTLEKYTSSLSVTSSAVSIKNMGFIGAGNFAQNYLLPHLKKSGYHLHTAVTMKGSTAKSVGDKFGFQNISTDSKAVLEEKSIPIVFIATRHASHAELTINGLKREKKIFLEKPLAVTEKELEEIKETYKKAIHPFLLVGYNRRFSCHAEDMKKFFSPSTAPMVIHYRVNAGLIDKEHWVQQETEGGRIIGEICHFIDFMQYLTNASPTHLYAINIHTDNKNIMNRDTLSVQISFSNGSVGNLIYLSNGNTGVAKEYIEVYGNSKIAILDDFKFLTFYQKGKKERKKKNEKGYKNEVLKFLHCVENGLPSPIPFQSLYITSLTTFAIKNSLMTGLPQKIHTSI